MCPKNDTQRITCLDTGYIYTNPKPHVKSIQACFPSVVLMDNGEMLASFTLGEAFESVDLRTCLSRSVDYGKTWEFQGRIYSETKDRLTSDASRITYLGGSDLIAFMVRHDRSDHPKEGLTNPKTLGFVPTELLALRSHDYGATWTKPQSLHPPLEGPSFELCSPITLLSNGLWTIPTQTWPGWDGHCPNGIQMIVLMSHDKGKTWPEYRTVMSHPEGRVFFWETKIVEFSDGTLMVLAWKYDDVKGEDETNQYSLSHDGGNTWTAPRSTGLFGQTLTPYILPDDRILCVYRRVDRPGLWGNLAHLQDGEWINDTQIPIWGHNSSKLVTTEKNMSSNFTKLRFGAPCITLLPNGDIFMAFWCVENCSYCVRWHTLRVE